MTFKVSGRCEIDPNSTMAEAMVLKPGEDNVGAVLFGTLKRSKEGDTVKRTKKLLLNWLARECLAVVDTLGIPSMEKGLSLVSLRDAT